MALIHTHFFSETLGMCAAADVILPQRKAAHRVAGEKFPTLWLLHGAGDDETAWPRRTSIERYAGRYGLAVVMPMAHLSRYADMVSGQRFFTFIADELPGIMRDMFPLSEKREDNLIAGLSMGGAGALRIGLSRPENYRAIGCLSAGLSNYERHDLDGTDPRREAQYRLAFGEGDFAELEGASFRLAEELAKAGKVAPTIFHTCGTEDPLLCNALKTKEFFEALNCSAFGYTYRAYPGVHNWAYWDEHIQEFLQWAQLPEQRGFCG